MLIPDTSGKPTASGALHYNPVRNLRLLFRLVNAGLLLSELRSARSPYTRHVPPTHRGKADGISTHGNLSSHVRDATFNALSGREDYSLRARRHTSSLHCTADNSIAFQSTKPRVARSICRVKERVSRLRRHPFARGRFTGDSTPCHTLPNKFARQVSLSSIDPPLRRRRLHSGMSNADTTPYAPSLNAHPPPRCTDRRSPYSIAAQCQPLHSLRVLSVKVDAPDTPHTFQPVLGALRSSEKCSPASGVSEATLTDNADLPPLL